jgi:hypothetical protein
MRTAQLLAVLAATTFASTAYAGFTAKQDNRSVGAGSIPTQSSTLMFEKGMLRMDPDKDSTVVIDMIGGKFSVISHKDKKHASVTIEELVQMQQQTVVQMKAQLGNPQMPPEIKKQLEAQIAELDSPAKPEATPKATGKKDKVNGYDCSIFTWKQMGRDHEACIATKVGVDVKEFAGSAVKLTERFTKASNGKGGSNMFAMIELAKHGFPVRMKQTIVQGATTMEAIQEMREIKAEKIEAAKFEIPAGYEKSDIQSVMGGRR